MYTTPLSFHVGVHNRRLLSFRMLEYCKRFDLIGKSVGLNVV